MSYLPPLKWWMRPFRFMSRCQRVNIEKQYHEYGIRLFDIRIKWDNKYRCWCFAHGAMVFGGKNVMDILQWLDNRADCMVRLVLEYNREPRNSAEICDRFVRLCVHVRHVFCNTVFFEFTRKWDWKKLYHYDGEPVPSIYQATSSTTWRIYDDWWPWIYAKVHNEDNRRQGTTSDWLLLDFVDI